MQQPIPRSRPSHTKGLGLPQTRPANPETLEIRAQGGWEGKGRQGSRHTYQGLGRAVEAGVEERRHGLPRRLHPQRRALPREFETGARAGTEVVFDGLVWFADPTTVPVDWTRYRSRQKWIFFFFFWNESTVARLVLFQGQFRPNSFLFRFPSLSPRSQNNEI